MSIVQENAHAWAIQDKGSLILTFSWIFTTFGAAFVILRGVAQGIVRKHLRSEDYWSILTLIFIVTSSALTTVSVSYGNGRHFVTLSTMQQENVILWMMSAYVPGITSLGLGKMAVIALLTRLLLPSRLHFWFLWFMGGLCVLILTTTVCTLMLQCSPPRALWDFSVEGRCLSPNILMGLSFLAGTFSAFLDFYLAIYPAVQLWKLQMPVKRKLTLSIALGLGLVSGAVAIYKTTGVPNLASTDVSYDLSKPLYWTIIEANVVLIAACVPVLQPLVDLVKGRGTWESVGRRSSAQYMNHNQRSSPSRSSVDAIKMLSKPQRRRDKYGLTIQDTMVSRTESESQQGFNNAPTGNMATPQIDGEGRGNPSVHGILRTDEVLIAFDGGENGPTSASKRWAPI